MQSKREMNVEIGKRIQSAREKAGFTQDRFAELIDMGSKSVSAIERGTVGVSLYALCRICRVLAVSSDSLLFGQEAKNDAQTLADRLERLSPKQFAIAGEILNKTMEAFSIGEESRR